jgi:hypothetical protein
MEHPVSDRSGDPSVSGRADHFEVAALSTPEVQAANILRGDRSGYAMPPMARAVATNACPSCWRLDVLARSLSHVARIERRKRRTAPSLGNVQRR